MSRLGDEAVVLKEAIQYLRHSGVYAGTRLAALLLFLSMVFCCLRLQAQDITSSVTGTVTDKSGHVVAGANVEATDSETGLKFQTRTNHDGVYSIQSLPPGPYTLAFSAPGYKQTDLSAFTLIGGQDARFDVLLAIGSATEVVNVTDMAPLLNTQDATLSTTIDAKMISQLPLMSDNIMTLGLLTPGAVQPSPSTFDNISHSAGFSNPSFNVNGNREQSNNFTVDGLDINDAIDNWASYTPSRNSLQEYRMITGNNTAEYGNANGGQVVMTTKSGTNQFHGEAFFSFQNTLMNANAWTNKHVSGTPSARLPLNRDYFGGTLGGPIFHDRLFFFVDYRGTRQHSSSYSYYDQPDAAVGGNPQEDETGQAALAGTGTAWDPEYNGGVGGVVKVTSPMAQYLLSHPAIYPVCNSAAKGTHCPLSYGNSSALYNYEGINSGGTRINQGDAKLDFRLNDHNLVSGRYTQVDNRYAPTIIDRPIDTPVNGNYPYHGAIVNWTTTITANLVNEARVGFSRSRFINIPVDISGLIGNKGLSDLGIPAPFQQVYPGMPAVTFAAADSVASGVGAPSGFGEVGKATIGVVNAFTYGDKMEWQKGKNTFKFGGQAIRYQENRFYSGNNGAIGTWAFKGTTGQPALSTGDAWGDFLTGEANSENVGNSAGGWGQRQWRPAFYFQDDYKALPNLTVNLGLRWEFDQPMFEVNNHENNINPVTGVVSYAGSIPSNATAGSPAVCSNRACYEPHYTGFMPRVGFAFTPEAFHNRLAVRGGYGITNFQEGLGANQRLVQNIPFVFSQSATATTNYIPTTTGYGALSSLTPATANANMIGWSPTYKPALVQQFNLGTMYEVNNHVSAQAVYVGQLGHHISDLIGLNQTACSEYPVVTGGTYCVSPLASSVLPNLATHNIQYSESEAVMNYNALQTTVNMREGHGLSYLFNWTYSKAMTDSYGYYGSGTGVSGSAFAYPQDSNNLAGDYGQSYFNAKHSISFAVTYKLPVGRGSGFIGNNWNHWLDTFLGGWNTAVVGVYHTGFFQTIYSTQYYKANIVSSSTTRANMYRPLKVVNRSFAHWLGTDPSAEGLGAFTTTTATCASTGKTYSQVTGTVGSTGVAGRTGASNQLIQAPTTTACASNPAGISLNPSVVESAVAHPAVASMGITAGSINTYTSNDNGTAAFGEELTTGFGTSQTGSVEQPGYHNFDASASKEFAMPKGIVLGFRADAYNVINGVSWGSFNANISNNSFGSIVSSPGTNTVERHLQLGLNLKF